MIYIKPMDNCDWDWTGLNGVGQCPQPQVWHSPSERVSAILGPDGEPLKVAYERPKMGFDLRPRSERQGKNSRAGGRG